MTCSRFWYMLGGMTHLKPGDPAPDFRAETNGGHTVSLKDYRGKYVVLFFYPKDNTPGCTKEACRFRDTYEDFLKRDIVVLGISVDSVKSHENFVEKFELPYPLVADPEKKIVNAYGVFGDKKFMGRTYQGTHRISFLIDPQGVISKIWLKVKPPEHADEVLASLPA